MKIKNSFISNSSSTSFIIAMSEGFILMEEEEKRLYDNAYNFDNKDDPKKTFEENLNKFIKHLKEEGAYIALDDGIDLPFSLYTFCYTIERILLDIVEYHSGYDEIINILGGKNKKEKIMKLMDQMKDCYIQGTSYDSLIKHNGEEI